MAVGGGFSESSWTLQDQGSCLHSTSPLGSFREILAPTTGAYSLVICTGCEGDLFILTPGFSSPPAFEASPALCSGTNSWLCTTVPNTLEVAYGCHLLVSLGKQATGSQAPFSQPVQCSRPYPLESNMSVHCEIFVPQREGRATTPITYFPDIIFSLVDNRASFSFLVLESMG